MKSIYGFMMAAGVAVLMCGCSSSPQRIQAGGNQAVTTMGVNLADFRNTAGELVSELLVHPAITRFEAQNGRLPVIDIGQVKNNSDIHIDLGQITGRIREDLLNSGQVEFMADGNSIVNTGEMADFFLEGTIMMLAERQGRTREKTYSFQMQLNDFSTGRMRWQRTIDVAKQGTRSSVGW